MNADIAPKPRRAVPLDKVRGASGKKIIPVPLDQVREAKGRKVVPVPRSKVASTRAFRRMRSDRLAGLAGVALVIVAVILLFTWPQPAVKKPPTFTVEWPEAAFPVFQENVTLTRAAGVFTQDVEIDAANITRVSLYVNWRDDVGDEIAEQDNVSLRLEGPAGTNKTLRIISSAGREPVNTTQDAVVGKKPDVREVIAETEPEARANLGDHTTRNGTGTWKLTLELLYVGDDYHGDAGNATRGNGSSCPQQTPPLATAVCTPDGGNVLEVRVSYRSYALALKPPSS